MNTPAQLCRERTAVENAWPTMQQAQGYARLVRAVSGVEAEAYQCPACGLWHARRMETGPELRIAQV